MEENPKEEVLIARNNETGQVGAVVGQNPDGTPKMADVKSTPLSELVKFTKGQNPLEASGQEPDDIRTVQALDRPV